MVPCQAGAALCPWHGPGLCSGLQGWSQWIAWGDLCTSQAVSSPWLKMIPLYLGFLRFALLFPASPSLLAGCVPAAAALQALQSTGALLGSA